MKEQERADWKYRKRSIEKIRDFEQNLGIRGRVTVKLKVLKVFYLKNKLGAKTNMIT